MKPGGWGIGGLVGVEAMIPNMASERLCVELPATPPQRDVVGAIIGS